MALKTNFQQNGKHIKEMGPVIPKEPVHIRFGDPMIVEGNGQSTHQAVVDFIKTHLQKWDIPIATSDVTEA